MQLFWTSGRRQCHCHQWSWCRSTRPLHSFLSQTDTNIFGRKCKISNHFRLTLVLFCPSFLAFWTDTIFPSSRVQTAVTSLPSGVVSSKGSPSWQKNYVILRTIIKHSLSSEQTNIHQNQFLDSYLELEFHCFESCGSFDHPSTIFFINLTDWSGHSGGFSQEKVDIKLL